MGHPAHFHLFKNTIILLKEAGHDVKILIKKKDIYIVECGEGELEFDTLQKAEDKIKRLHKSEEFGYLIKTEFDKEGKITNQTFIG